MAQLGTALMISVCAFFNRGAFFLKGDEGFKEGGEGGEGQTERDKERALNPNEQTKERNI